MCWTRNERWHWINRARQQMCVTERALKDWLQIIRLFSKQAEITKSLDVGRFIYACGALKFEQTDQVKTSSNCRIAVSLQSPPWFDYSTAGFCAHVSSLFTVLENFLWSSKVSETINRCFFLTIGQGSNTHS